MKFLNPFYLTIATMCLITAGCTQPKESVDNMNQEKMPKVDMAVAVVHPTKGNDTKGVVTFKKGSDGVQVHTEVTGLTPGKHGFHIHLYGDCRADDGTSAGTHFNFIGSSKNPPADINRITGNLGVLTAGENGEATADTLISNAKLSGKKSIMGRAVVIHAKDNDPSQPPIGAAGARVGCGVIGIANPEL